MLPKIQKSLMDVPLGYLNVVSAFHLICPFLKILWLPTLLWYLWCLSFTLCINQNFACFIKIGGVPISLLYPDLDVICVACFSKIPRVPILLWYLECLLIYDIWTRYHNKVGKYAYLIMIYKVPTLLWYLFRCCFKVPMLLWYTLVPTILRYP